VHDGGISIAVQESGSSSSSIESGIYDVGLAVGIVGEISVETLRRMAEVCKQLVVDVQALIRTVDPSTGLVGLVKLENTPFDALLHRISFLKAAYNESLFIDIARARERTSIIVTRGKLGCTVYCKEAEFSVPAFQACEVDPTGAGDSFLAGFSAGLYHGFSVRDAALIGNYFGALAVAQVGLPTFSHLDIQVLLLPLPLAIAIPF
jgi:1D-myo-inositol 3-kinase